MDGVIKLTADQLSLTRSPAEKFFKESGIDGELNFEHFCKAWGGFIQLDMAAIFVYCRPQDEAPLGIIGGLITPCTMTGELIAMESFWWVDPSLRGGTAGIRLLNTWESEMLHRGAKRIYVGNLWSLNNNKMQKLYDRLGYQPLEVHYVKTL